MRWYGGKWRIADWVVSFFPKHDTYVEAYGGAASVLMKKKPARVEVYNDLYYDIYNFFRVLRNPFQYDHLRHLLRLTPYCSAEFDACAHPSEDPVEQARRTFIRACMSINPGKALRGESSGFRSTSRGDYRLPQSFISMTENLDAVVDRLRGVVIENRTAKKICLVHDAPDTLHYLDPPYMGITRSVNRSNVYVHELRSVDEHRELYEYATQLKGYVVLSGYDSPFYRDWYGGAGWTYKSTQTANGSGIRGKTSATEVLWLNPRCQDAQKQLDLFAPKNSTSK